MGKINYNGGGSGGGGSSVLSFSTDTAWTGFPDSSNGWSVPGMCPVSRVTGTLNDGLPVGCVPFFCARNLQINEAKIQVSSGNGNYTAMELALFEYDDPTDGWASPITEIWRDTSSVDPSTGGSKEITGLTVNLEGGKWYGSALLFEATSGTMTVYGRHCIQSHWEAQNGIGNSWSGSGPGGHGGWTTAATDTLSPFPTWDDYYSAGSGNYTSFQLIGYRWVWT